MYTLCTIQHNKKYVYLWSSVTSAIQHIMFTCDYLYLAQYNISFSVIICTLFNPAYACMWSSVLLNISWKLNRFNLQVMYAYANRQSSGILRVSSADHFNWFNSLYSRCIFSQMKPSDKFVCCFESPHCPSLQEDPCPVSQSNPCFPSNLQHAVHGREQNFVWCETMWATCGIRQLFARNLNLRFHEESFQHPVSINSTLLSSHNILTQWRIQEGQKEPYPLTVDIF